MPYCPKCDMEFIDGITVCTDCGGPLVESEEAARAMKAAERAKERARETAMYKEYLKELDAGETDGFEETGYPATDGSPDTDETGGPGAEEDAADGTESVQSEEELRALQAEAARRARSILPPEPVHVYVDKSQKFDDLKSSATAFLMVGGVLLVISALCWTNIIYIPMASVSKIIFQSALTIMGLFSMAVFLKTFLSAKKLAPEIEGEKNRTQDIIRWFMDKYTADEIDGAIPDMDALSDEELSLKRFQLIQDYLITGQDLPDPSYVDALSEEIYAKLYEN